MTKGPRYKRRIGGCAISQKKKASGNPIPGGPTTSNPKATGGVMVGADTQEETQ